MRAHQLGRSAVLLAGTFLSMPAAAQLASMPQMPRERVIDGNNVDLVTGTYISPSSDLTIGTEQSGLVISLKLVSGLWWVSNYHIALETTANSATLVTGAEKKTFSGSGPAWTPADADGSSLSFNATTQNYLYTARDGTQITIPNATRRASQIKQPNGVTFTLHYDQSSVTGPPAATFYRLRSIGSSNGHQVRLTYALSSMSNNANNYRDWATPGTVAAFTNGSEACQPSATTCTLTITWPALVFSGTLGLTVDTPAGQHRYTSAQYAAGNYRVTAVRRPSSTITDNTVISYDANNRVSQVVTDNRTWTYAYSLSGNQMTTSVTWPGAATPRVIVSDVALGVPLSVTDELGRMTGYSYNTNGRLTRITQPEGNYTEFTRDGRGNATQTKQVAKTPGTPVDIVVSASFDAACSNPVTCNKPNSTTDARGKVTDFTYDSTHGGMLSQTLPAPTTGAVRPQTRYGYSSYQAYFKNASGSIVASGVPTWLLTSTSACQTLASCANAADEVKTTIGYGLQVAGTVNALYPQSITKASGDGALSATTTYSYNNMGDVILVDGPLSGTVDRSRYRYDDARRTWGIIAPDPDGTGPLLFRAQLMTFEADDVIKTQYGTVEAPGPLAWDGFVALEEVETYYDVSGRKIRDVSKRGSSSESITQYSYDARGRLECVAQRLNPAAFGSLPASACDLGPQGALGPDRIIKTSYDAADRVIKVEEGLLTTAANNERRMAYTANGRVQWLMDAENNLTAFEYDGHDRLSKTFFPNPNKGSADSNGSDYEHLTYETTSSGTRTSQAVATFRNRANENIHFTYDNLNRLTFKNLPNSEPDVTYSYDNLSRLITASQTGHALSYTYDALGRTLTQSGPQGTSCSQWDVAGRRTRLIYSGSCSSPTLYVDYDYLVSGEVSKVRENGATSGVGVLATYGHDNLGRKTSQTFGNGVVQNYGYGPHAAIQSLTNNIAGTLNDLTQTVSYDSAGGIASVSGTNDAYTWTGPPTDSRTYTVNGLNQYTSINSASLGYDARGNLTSDGANSFGYSSENFLLTGPNSTTLSYDPQMRLFQVASAATTKFAYDGDNRIAEYGPTNTVLRRYVHGAGSNDPIVWYEGSGTGDRRFLSSDLRGSIISVTDGSGNSLGLNKYDEYGTPQIDSSGNSLNVGRFQYTGKPWLPEIGLYYFNSRMYSPTTGRFMQPDPIGYGDGLNFYAYVRNDPVNYADSLGLNRRSVHGGSICRAGSACYVTFYKPVYTYQVAWNYDSAGNVQIWDVTLIGVTPGYQGSSFFDGLNGVQFADLNFLEKALAKTAYRRNPNIRKNIRRIVKEVTGKTYSDAEIDAIMKDILKGQSTEIDGLTRLGGIQSGRNLSPIEMRTIDAYIRELPSSPLNNEVKNAWGKYKSGR